MTRLKRKTPLTMASYRLPDDVLAMVNQMAGALNTSRTHVVEAAIRAQFKRYVKAMAKQES